MKKTITVLLVVALVSASSVSADSFGSGFGSLQIATTSGMGSGHLMGVLGLADATSFGGIFTYGLSKNTDGRIKLGLFDGNGGSGTDLFFGADFKYNFISKSELQNGPFDMAGGGFFEYYDSDYVSVWSIGGQYIGSYPIEMENKSMLTPYGRVNVRIESVTVDFNTPGLSDYSESNLEVGLNAGVKWGVNQNFDLYGEFQLDGNDGIFFGIDFRVM